MIRFQGLLATVMPLKMTRMIRMTIRKAFLYCFWVINKEVQVSVQTVQAKLNRQVLTGHFNIQVEEQGM